MFFFQNKSKNAHHFVFTFDHFYDFVRAFLAWKMFEKTNDILDEHKHKVFLHYELFHEILA